MPQAAPPPSLLLAAVPQELADLAQAPPPGWSIRCLGVGAVNAAAATARLLAELKPRRVLFVGTCGSMDSRLSIGDCIEATEALSVSIDELEGRSYRPRLEQVRWPATFNFPGDLALPKVAVAVPLGVTRTFEGSTLLGGQAPVEHLELSGVFAACHTFGIPCGAVLAVSNQVGPEGHREWKANNERVSAQLIQELQSKGVFNSD